MTSQVYTIFFSEFRWFLFPGFRLVTSTVMKLKKAHRFSFRFTRTSTMIKCFYKIERENYTLQSDAIQIC